MSTYTAGRFAFSTADHMGQQWTLKFRHNDSVTSQISIISCEEVADLEYVVKRAVQMLEQNRRK